jgi:hypothetical protein
MAQMLRAVVFSVGLAICLSLVAYFGLPATTVLLIPGFWLSVKVHVPDILGIHSTIVASVVIYSALILLTLQAVHLGFSLSHRIRLAWLRWRL